MTISAAAYEPGRAERRQLTIMFCDLFNSVRLSSLLDPEDLRDVIGAYQEACAKCVAQYGGYTARFVGDGILICFGYPAAHEDDAERAVRAGLEIVNTVANLNGRIGLTVAFDLQVRIGIATGLVVAGDVVTGEVSNKDAMVGEAANLAARLQEFAGPNSIVVSSSTRILAGEAFEYRNLGSRDFKGFGEPVLVYQVLGQRQVTRLEARSPAPAPFINREQEVALLLRCWQDVLSGEAGLVIIVGEAGIGKSRIVAEFQSRIEAVRHSTTSRALVFQCSPYHTNAPLYPVARELERAAGIIGSDSNGDKFSKLLALVGNSKPEHYERASLLGDLLGVDENRQSISPAGSAAKRHQIMAALLEWCLSDSGLNPLVIVFEDVQWIDPSSKLFLSQLAKVKDTRVLIVVTLRTDDSHSPETLVEQLGKSFKESLGDIKLAICEVQELVPDEAKRLAVAVGGDQISESALASILPKAQGIPLYVEELAKATATGLTRISAAEGGQPTSVPITIRDALMARLDHLAEAKELAQLAAVIGQEFSADLLSEVAGKPIAQWQPLLDRLIDARIVVASTASANVYQFRHALIRDVAYRSLLRRDRRDIHRRIARCLERASAVAILAPEHLIAQHLSLGGAYSEAIKYWQRGAEEAIARSAYEEALGMLRAALEDLKRLRDSGTPEMELELVLAQAVALRSIRGYSAPEVEELLMRARELCTACNDTKNRFYVEWGLFQSTLVKGDIVGAHQLATGLYRHAGEHPEKPWVDAHLAIGMAAFHFGDFESAAENLEKGVNASNLEVDQPRFLTHGQSPGLFCLSYLARTQCLLGLLDQARENINRGLAVAKALSRDQGHLYGYVNVLIHAARVYDLCGDFRVEGELASLAVDISRRNHFAYYEAMGLCHLGWVKGVGGSLTEGIEQMLNGMAALAGTGTALALPGFNVLLAQLYLRSGQSDLAAEALSRATGIRSFRTRAWEAEIERVRGDIASQAAKSNWEEAESAYRSSLAIARVQKAGLLVFKAGFSLTRLLLGLKRSEEAYVALQQCLERLPEGFDIPEVKDARTALMSLNL